MIHHPILTEVTEELLVDHDQTNYVVLKEKLEKLKSLLMDMTGLDLNQEENRADIQFDNGIAIGSAWAALCVVDHIRTKQFVRGLFKAVNQLLEQKTEPVRILYAGTGPFATLMLPLLTQFTPDQLQFILFEVNPQTLQQLNNVIKQFQIEDYIESIICEDASTYQFEHDPNIHIFLSETMQHGLQKEQQVPITLNLMQQLGEDVILIPSKIKLDLALMNSSSKLMFEGLTHLQFKELETLLEFDKKFVSNYLNSSNQSGQFELCKQQSFKAVEDYESYDKLVILTSIETYGNEWIENNSSSLTIPKTLLFLNSIDDKLKEISMNYVIKKLPDFELELH